jgi:uncharacterized repeat protein (TIGR04076 family)
MKIIATVIKGKCQGGYHKIGDQFKVEGDLIPGGICSGALLTMIPAIIGLQNGAKYRWEKDKDKTIVHCADEPGISIELERVEE